MLVAYVVGCLLQIFYTVIYISVLHRNRKTLVDDQMITFGINTAQPPQAGYISFELCLYSPTASIRLTSLSGAFPGRFSVSCSADGDFVLPRRSYS